MRYRRGPHVDNDSRIDPILLHLDAMEARIRSDIAEVRKDSQRTAELAAMHTVRLDHAEQQLRWIWGGFGSALLGLLTAVGTHLLGWIGVGTHHGR